MMRCVATCVLMLLTIILAAIYLPLFYARIFFKPVEKTHLLFSPVTQRFLYKEKIVGELPPEALRKSEDHHAEIVYRDEDGTFYSRVEFEQRLPFIYYKNMELWGLLPLRLNGRLFDKAEIKENRQVLELKAGEINDRRVARPLWPLLESSPGQVRLVFPEDRFRMTARAMEFVNADTNAVDPVLTTRFTNALKMAGFRFPARSVNGKFTILKPFDEGVFLVDDAYRVFHVKRRDNQPVVVRTPIDQALETRHIKISENKRRQYYGLLLAGDDRLYLLTYDDYRLVPLPLETYQPNRMDFKLLINPLYLTGVWSDEATIRAVAMDRAYRPLSRYAHTMSRAMGSPMETVYHLLFPFSLQLKSDDTGFIRFSFTPGSWLSLIGILIGLFFFVIGYRSGRGRWPGMLNIAVVALTGLYGIITVSIIHLEAR